MEREGLRCAAAVGRWRTTYILKEEDLCVQAELNWKSEERCSRARWEQRSFAVFALRIKIINLRIFRAALKTAELPPPLFDACANTDFPNVYHRIPSFLSPCFHSIEYLWWGRANVCRMWWRQKTKQEEEVEMRENKIKWNIAKCCVYFEGGLSLWERKKHWAIAITDARPTDTRRPLLPPITNNKSV